VVKCSSVQWSGSVLCSVVLCNGALMQVKWSSAWYAMQLCSAVLCFAIMPFMQW
jgi:hypothetical protein